MQLCFDKSWLNYCQLFCATYDLVLMYILNSIFVVDESYNDSTSQFANSFSVYSVIY